MKGDKKVIEYLNKVLYNELMKVKKNSIFQKYQSKSLLSVALVPYRDL